LAVLTARQAEILSAVFELGHANVRNIADRLGSPNRLRRNLEELKRKHLLHMESVGNQHRFTVTKMGLRSLAAYGRNMAGSLIGSLGQIGEAVPETARGTVEQIVRAILAHPKLRDQIIEAMDQVRDDVVDYFADEWD
jgi:predicted ArsR family transcriptional regulator